MFVMDLALALDMGYYAGSTEGDGTDGAIWEGEKKRVPGLRARRTAWRAGIDDGEREADFNHRSQLQNGF
jgi:hypothetical protein